MARLKVGQAVIAGGKRGHVLHFGRYTKTEDGGWVGSQVTVLFGTAVDDFPVDEVRPDDEPVQPPPATAYIQQMLAL